MPFCANVYRVFIASPGDVEAERKVIREVVAEWNAVNAEKCGLVLMPMGWDTDSSPLMGAHPQVRISQQVLSNTTARDQMTHLCRRFLWDAVACSFRRWW